jgi:hypothetical protein
MSFSKHPCPSVLQLAEDLAKGGHLTLNERNQIFQFVRRMTIPDSSLKIGDKVAKRAGYLFPGEIRSIFVTKRGLMRTVVEADVLEFEGMLHIYAPEQLMPRTK